MSGPSHGTGPTFHLEWGGSESLTVEEIWPDGDAPENPTTDDVIAAMRKTAGTISEWGAARWVADEWNLEVQDVEVSGPGGYRSLARVLRDERVARDAQVQNASRDAKA